MECLHVESFIAVIHNNESSILEPLKQNKSKWLTHYKSTPNGKIELAFIPRNPTKRIKIDHTHHQLTLLLGDDAEYSSTSHDQPIARGAKLRCDLHNNRIEALSSIIALPPVFHYKTDNVSIFVSEPYLLTLLSGIEVDLDIKAVSNLFQIGYPLHNRTLFKNLSIVPAGHIQQDSVDGDSSLEKAWQLPETDPLPDRNSFIDFEIQIFKDIVKTLDRQGNYLSLTAGLDTRAIFAAMLNLGITMPACTITEGSNTIDAKIAQQLCNKYGIKHELINLDEQFIRNLPDHTLEASKLSGGLTSLEQAHEVYFYKATKGIGTHRISGNLGNQYARGGVESLSMRQADKSILHHDIADTNQDDIQHWLSSVKLDNKNSLFLSLLQQEVPFSSVGNFMIGQHHSIQTSPYADRNLIEAFSKQPVDWKTAETFQLRFSRFKDLYHRFFGVPFAYSFQRQLIARTGGFVSECPINWGWRANGGLSSRDSINGVLAIADVIASRQGIGSRFLAKALNATNTRGLEEYLHFELWFSKYLKDFVHDVFDTSQVRNSGHFNMKKVNRLLHEHYSKDRSHYKTLIAALDVALAINIFQR